MAVGLNTASESKWFGKLLFKAQAVINVVCNGENARHNRFTASRMYQNTHFETQ